MKQVLFAIAAIVLFVSGTNAQGTAELYTRPEIPGPEALDRLNLKVGWRAALPMAGKKDGIFSFQFAGKEILVQSRSGLIAALDRDTGKKLWSTRVGTPFQPSNPIGYNAKAVFVVQGTWLYAVDRKTGQSQWRFSLPEAAAAGPVADDDQLYISIGTAKFSAYQLPAVSRRNEAVAGLGANKNFLPPPVEAQPKIPDFYRAGSGTARGIGPLSSVAEASRSRETGPQPILRWDFRAPTELEIEPIIGGVDILWAGADGSVLAMPKTTEISGKPYRFRSNGPITAPPAQHGELAYIGSHDGNLYNLHIPSGKIVWRFTCNNPILQKPLVTDEDVYIAPKSDGLYRLNRTTGQTIWRNAEARRILANNPKFVYAADSNGKFFVLDRSRGTTLSRFDGFSGFVVPIANELTDRVYLASNDGLLVCLHDREYGAPLTMKGVEEKPVTPVKPDKPIAPKQDKPNGPKEPKDPKPDKPEKPQEKPAQPDKPVQPLLPELQPDKKP